MRRSLPRASSSKSCASWRLCSNSRRALPPATSNFSARKESKSNVDEEGEADEEDEDKDDDEDDEDEDEDDDDNEADDAEGSSSSILVLSTGFFSTAFLISERSHPGISASGAP